MNPPEQCVTNVLQFNKCVIISSFRNKQRNPLKENAQLMVDDKRSTEQASSHVAAALPAYAKCFEAYRH